MTQTLRNKKGVTLVELLAVIVILGIIAAIAVPTIGGLIERQRANAAGATFTSVEEAARLYAADLDPADVFSLQDLLDDDMLSETVVLTTDAAGTEVVTTNDIFLVATNGSVSIVMPGVETGLYINGYLVYGT
ncbi:MAG: prepilin-type N-terminal cleavage/methylation domain-containing protein [Bacillota bacterium]